ncbi:ferritin-like domain-containing protein [Candidatus Pyrohabitans sp.]
MAGEELKEMLNRAIAREMQVAIQYMWQHIQAKGILGEAASPILRQIAIQEMLHAEQIAERLSYLGGEPTTKPARVVVGDSLREMLELDIEAEEEAIEMYREIIKKADEESDIVTRKLFENILIDEEKHHDTFLRMREGM